MNLQGGTRHPGTQPYSRQSRRLSKGLARLWPQNGHNPPTSKASAPSTARNGRVLAQKWPRCGQPSRPKTRPGPLRTECSRFWAKCGRNVGSCGIPDPGGTEFIAMNVISHRKRPNISQRRTSVTIFRSQVTGSLQPSGCIFLHTGALRAPCGAGGMVLKASWGGGGWRCTGRCAHRSPGSQGVRIPRGKVVPLGEHGQHYFLLVTSVHGRSRGSPLSSW